MLKANFVEPYEARLHSGLGTATQHGYHGEANANEDNDEITMSIDNSIAHIQMVNSAQTTMLNENIQAKKRETSTNV